MEKYQHQLFGSKNNINHIRIKYSSFKLFARCTKIKAETFGKLATWKLSNLNAFGIIM